MFPTWMQLNPMQLVSTVIIFFLNYKTNKLGRTENKILMCHLRWPFLSLRFADRKLVSPFSGCEENLSTFISNSQQKFTFFAKRHCHTPSAKNQ